jgi:hypothetical protein
MKMFRPIAALVAANLLLPLLLVVRAAARTVASIIIDITTSTVTPAKAGAQLAYWQKSRVPAFAGMTKSNWVIERDLHERKRKRPFSRRFSWRRGTKGGE